MKSTGMVRKVDELGRVVIPIELRRSLDIKEKDAIEIYVDEDQIVLKKYVPNMACHITGENTSDNVALANGKLVLSPEGAKELIDEIDRKSTRLNSSHVAISYAVFCLKKKTNNKTKKYGERKTHGSCA